jgi:hypothetical protein
VRLCFGHAVKGLQNRTVRRCLKQDLSFIRFVPFHKDKLSLHVFQINELPLYQVKSFEFLPSTYGASGGGVKKGSS